VQPPPQRAFAVVEVGPTQFKVAVDDMIVTERLRGADVNQTVALNRVLMLGDQDETRIGRPLVPDARVIAAVEVRSMCQGVLFICGCSLPGIGAPMAFRPPHVQQLRLHEARRARNVSKHELIRRRSCAQEQFLDGKVLIFKKRRRKNSRRLNGHRQVNAEAVTDHCEVCQQPKTAS
jgi:ribosomal protein L21